MSTSMRVPIPDDAARLLVGFDDRPHAIRFFEALIRDRPMLDQALAQTRDPARVPACEVFKESFKAIRLRHELELIVVALRTIAPHGGRLEEKLEEALANGTHPRNAWRGDARLIMDAYIQARFVLRACQEAARGFPSGDGAACWAFVCAATRAGHDQAAYRALARL